MLFYFPLLRGSFEAGNFHNNDGNWISEGMETGMEGKESKKTKGARRAEADVSRYMLGIKYKIKEKREAEPDRGAVFFLQDKREAHCRSQLFSTYLEHILTSYILNLTFLLL